MSIVIKNPQPIPPPLWNKLTFLRGICAFYVMISHAWYQVWPAAEPPLGYRKTPEGIILAVYRVAIQRSFCCSCFYRY